MIYIIEYKKVGVVYEDTARQTAAYPSLEPLPLTTYLSATVIVRIMSSWADNWDWGTALLILETMMS